MKVSISPPDPTWPATFTHIKTELESALSHEGAVHTTILHIGSTAVPHLPAKPILDIAIVIPHWLCLERVADALNYGGPHCLLPSYLSHGDGGVRDRPSFKSTDSTLLPRRNIYVVLEDSIVLRAWRDLVSVLTRDPALRTRYAWTKMRLADRGEYEDVMQYALAKNVVVRDILREAGWSEEEIAEKEGMATRDWAGDDDDDSDRRGY